jgi:hypothetical protein
VIEIALERGADGVYTLSAIGTLRRDRIGRVVTAETGDDRWRIARTRPMSRDWAATDIQGMIAGRFHHTTTGPPGGSIDWEGTRFYLGGARRPNLRSFLSRSYLGLHQDNREIAVFEFGGAERPVDVRLTEPDAIPPGALLFATALAWRRVGRLRPSTGF